MSRVVIVGGGIIGLCTALYCREAGFEVTVLEVNKRSDKPCSWGNAGMIVPSHVVPLAAPGMVKTGLSMMLDPGAPFGFYWPPAWETMVWAAKFVASCTKRHVERTAPFLSQFNLLSRDLYADLDRRLGGFHYQQTGLLELFKGNEGLKHGAETADLALQLGQKVDVLSRDQVMELEPSARPDVAGGVYYQEDAHIDPGATLDMLRDHLSQHDVEILFEHKAVDLEQGSDKITAVITDKERFSADHVVLANGIWSFVIAQTVGYHVEVESGKGYSFVVEGLETPPRIPSILVDARIAVSPLGSGTRFAGTMEIGGTLDRHNPRRVSRMARSIERFYPSIKAESLVGIEAWTGLRPCSPDGVPIIGHVPGWKNLVLATGHAMMGMSLGPATGLVVSQLLQGLPTTIDLRPAAPERFS